MRENNAVAPRGGAPMQSRLESDARHGRLGGFSPSKVTGKRLIILLSSARIRDFNGAGRITSFERPKEIKLSPLRSSLSYEFSTRPSRPCRPGFPCQNLAARCDQHRFHCVSFILVLCAAGACRLRLTLLRSCMVSEFGSVHHMVLWVCWEYAAAVKTWENSGASSRQSGREMTAGMGVSAVPLRRDG